MPATLSPSELTVKNVTAESVRAEGEARRLYGGAAPTGRCGADRMAWCGADRTAWCGANRAPCGPNSRCAKADNGGASIDASATTTIIG